MEPAVFAALDFECQRRTLEALSGRNHGAQEFRAKAISTFFIPLVRFADVVIRMWPDNDLIFHRRTPSSDAICPIDFD